MLYLSSFTFPGEDREWNWRVKMTRTDIQTIYPFYILPQHGMDELFFKPITILYGGNGSGKSTVLNVIAEKLSLRRETPCNRTPFFEDFVSMCRFGTEAPIPPGSRIITSDDVFDFMLNLRSFNDGVDIDRKRIYEEYREFKSERFQLRSMDDYDHLKHITDARRMTQSRYAAQEGTANVREHSNGESAFLYFREHIEEDALYLLDEPENSLSPENQKKLADFLFESVRYLGCQLIISTHSPFLLALPGAKIVDLDARSEIVESWTTLPNVRAYYDFFKKNAAAFED